MTTPIQPASDEMIERLRPHFPDGTKDVVPQLIARIDAERAHKEMAQRAFKAEAERGNLIDEQTALFVARRAGWLDPADHAVLLADLSKAEAERDAERAARERAEGERDAAVETLRIVRRNLDAARDDHDADAASLKDRAERAEALLARAMSTRLARVLDEARAALSRKDGG